MRTISALLAAGFLALSVPAAHAQGHGDDKDKDKKDKDYKEYKGDKDRYEGRDKDDKDRYKDREKDEKDRYKERDKEDKERYKDREKEDKERYKDRNKREDRDGYDDRDRGRDGRYGNGRGYPTRTGGVLGDVLGWVILPSAGTNGPRHLEGVPRGQYPPPGECRIWYPNRPAGQQPPPRSCDSLVGVRLEPGAFILHGDEAYDASYNWRDAERRRPGTVGRDILDILYPRR